MPPALHRRANLKTEKTFIQQQNIHPFELELVGILMISISDHLSQGLPSIQQRELYYKEFLQNIPTSLPSIEALKDLKRILEAINQASFINSESIDTLKGYHACIRNVRRLFNVLNGDTKLISIFMNLLKKFKARSNIDKNKLIKDWIQVLRWMQESHLLPNIPIQAIFEDQAIFYSAYYIMHCMKTENFFDSKYQDKLVVGQFLRSPDTLEARWELIQYLQDSSLLTERVFILLSQITFSEETTNTIWNGLSGLYDAKALEVELVEIVLNIVFNIQCQQELRYTKNVQLMREIGNFLLILGQTQLLDLDILKAIESSPHYSVELLNRFQNTGLLILGNKPQLTENLWQADTRYEVYKNLELIEIDPNVLLFSKQSTWIECAEKIVSTLKKRKLWSKNFKNDIQILFSRKDISMHLDVLSTLEGYQEINSLDVEINQRVIQLETSLLRELHESLEFFRQVPYSLTRDNWLSILNDPCVTTALIRMFGALNTSQTDIDPIPLLIYLIHSIESRNEIERLRNVQHLSIDTLSSLVDALEVFESIKGNISSIEAYNAYRRSIFSYLECAYPFVDGLRKLPHDLHSDLHTHLRYSAQLTNAYSQYNSNSASIQCTLPFEQFWAEIKKNPQFSEKMIQAYCAIHDKKRDKNHWRLITQYYLCADQIKDLINQGKATDNTLQLLNHCLSKNSQYITKVANALVMLPTTLWGFHTPEESDNKPTVIKLFTSLLKHPASEENNNGSSVIAKILASIEKHPHNAMIIAEAALTLFKGAALNSKNWGNCRPQRRTTDEVLGSLSKKLIQNPTRHTTDPSHDKPIPSRRHVKSYSVDQQAFQLIQPSNTTARGNENPPKASTSMLPGDLIMPRSQSPALEIEEIEEDVFSEDVFGEVGCTYYADELFSPPTFFKSSNRATQMEKDLPPTPKSVKHRSL